MSTAAPRVAMATTAGGPVSRNPPDLAGLDSTAWRALLLPTTLWWTPLEDRALPDTSAPTERLTRSVARLAPTIQTQGSHPAHLVRLATTAWKTPPPMLGATALLGITALKEPGNQPSSPAVLALTMLTLVSTWILPGIHTVLALTMHTLVSTWI